MHFKVIEITLLTIFFKYNLYRVIAWNEHYICWKTNSYTNSLIVQIRDSINNIKIYYLFICQRVKSVLVHISSKGIVIRKGPKKKLGGGGGEEALLK